ncbi:MAG: hypothetical protein H6709_21275 [Kofleriaceae bacterium]|nr:hypothetical protein [Myxococcales bacterium]MCB9561662.1 hypothetical protein [Kofleriaceae bacterium]MCB9574616.1 hypothetical protein [Kofleriaceae bacterium]
MNARLPVAIIGGLITILGITGSVYAQGEPVKPYVFLVVDTSGSMNDTLTVGPPSCAGGGANKLDHAKCAINQIAASYGEMVLGLGRFRETTNDTDCSNGCSMSGASCGGCNTGTGAGCTSTMSSDVRLEVLTGLVDGGNDDVITWTDFTCGTCGANLASNPDLYANGATPIAGALKGAKRYFQGLQGSDGTTTLWPSNAAGFDPIRNDPLKDVFLPSGAQCRPYIVIMLTDGDETCAPFATTTAAASSLLTTTVDGQDYRIEVKPIGFGQTPPDTQIEGLAHAGGAVDVNGVSEGYYAQNEEDLQLAISQIIQNAIKFETCNELDDDCDLLIDEDFPNKGGACDNGLQGVCRGTGTYVCNASGTGTECVITNPGGMASAETCDGTDEDCDGLVDEGACMGCFGVELCNNVDDDCDLAVDEDLTRPCGTDLGVCSPGTETCVAGVWQGCDATGGSAETCNGLDDDCNGTVDGFGEPCSDLPGGNPNQGPCHPGTHVCPADGSGMFGTCIGEVGPETEACDTIDNDCDGIVDEDTGGADCSSTCGVGTTVCVNGTIQCDAQPAVDDETCNNVDDDCDGMIDEDAPPGPPCDGGGTVCNGNEVCVNGNYVCQGDPVGVELCNCLDDDCDVQVDEDTCGGTSTCVHPSQAGFACQCAQPCAGGEFPCPIGRVCVDNFCLVDPCAGVTCSPDGNGDQTECQGGTCVRSCDLVTCPTGLVCYGPDGQCRPDDCTTFPDRCTGDEVCVGGTCVADPCAGVTCATDQYCVGGGCFDSCAGVSCPDGQRCRLGACEPEPCPGGCDGTRVCDEDSGECVPNLCSNQQCPSGERCNPVNGQCEQDPCLGVHCPGTDQICDEGSCFDVDHFTDAMVEGDDAGNTFVTAGGGGGCATGGGGGGLLGGLLVAGAALAVRRRRGGRA